MSIGKYSPNLPHCNDGYEDYNYNSHGEQNHCAEGAKWVDELHFCDYDQDGYDYYGYSAFNASGDFVGTGLGVDRNGITELEYISNPMLLDIST